MNNKILIPGVALGAVLIALAFVVAPVQEAAAVHTSIGSNTIRHFFLTATVGPDTGTDDAVDEQASWTMNQPFEVINVLYKATADTGANCDLGIPSIRTDMFPEAGTVEPNPAVTNLNTDSRSLMSNVVTTQSPPFGNVVLTVTLLEEATCDADARGTLGVIVETTGALTTAPTAVIATITAAKGGGLAGD